MMNRTNKILAGLFGIQMLIVALVWMPKSSETYVSTQYFPDLTADNLEAVSFQDPKEGTLEFTKKEDQWVISQLDGYPVDTVKFNDFLLNIKTLKTSVPVGKTENAHKRFEVDEESFVRKIQLTLKEEDGSQKEEGLYLGNVPQFRQLHLRKINDDKVYMTDRIHYNEVSVSPQEWMKTEIVQLDSDQLNRVEILGTKKEFVFIKQEKEVPLDDESKEMKTVSYWTLQGREVDSKAMNILLRNLTGLKAKDVVERATELKPTKEGSIFTIHMSYQVPGESEDQKLTLKVQPLGEKQFHVFRTDQEFILLGTPHQLKSIPNLSEDKFFKKG